MICVLRSARCEGDILPILLARMHACKAAETVKEAKELVEAGFEYVTSFEGYKLFRKRK